MEGAGSALRCPERRAPPNKAGSVPKTAPGNAAIRPRIAHVPTLHPISGQGLGAARPPDEPPGREGGHCARCTDPQPLSGCETPLAIRPRSAGSGRPRFVARAPENGKPRILRVPRIVGRALAQKEDRFAPALHPPVMAAGHAEPDSLFLGGNIAGIHEGSVCEVGFMASPDVVAPPGPPHEGQTTRGSSRGPCPGPPPPASSPRGGREPGPG